MKFKCKIEEILGITCPHDWNKVTRRKLLSSPEGKIFRYITVLEFLKVVYPTNEWESKHSINWKDLNQVRSYVSHVECLLKIQKPEDWYYISKQQVVLII
eukprot:TRINITY_DN4499_c0_g3_i1.p2 TRINITY_DN4499_c0_g3~~TRINITY_DN4499_c0_g3_i1.p2  ORF type:complete len:100 (-),score=22.52 TRINITY_DN4499_c0_g3_i1:229-528(-)